MPHWTPSTPSKGHGENPQLRASTANTTHTYTPQEQEEEEVATDSHQEDQEETTPHPTWMMGRPDDHLRQLPGREGGRLQIPRTRGEGKRWKTWRNL